VTTFVAPVVGETDPVALAAVAGEATTRGTADAALTAALANLAAVAATDADLAAAVATLTATLGGKQDAATAATDVELVGVQSAVDALGAMLTAYVARIVALESGHIWAGYEEGAWLNYVNGVPVWLPGVTTGVTTEAGDFLATEGGDLLLLEV
jgi:hypothetical protein